MSAKNGTKDTKYTFKLPKGVDKGKIVKAYSTSTKVTIEGYFGTIETIGNPPDKKDSTFIACRDAERHGGRAWIQVRA